MLFFKTFTEFSLSPTPNLARNSSPDCLQRDIVIRPETHWWCFFCWRFNYFNHWQHFNEFSRSKNLKATPRDILGLINIWRVRRYLKPTFTSAPCHLFISNPSLLSQSFLFHFVFIIFSGRKTVDYSGHYGIMTQCKGGFKIIKENVWFLK